MKPDIKRDMKNECHLCKYKRELPGESHILCSNPDWSMRGHPHGIKNGWFIYPLVFDPVWKMKDCENFEEIDE